MVTKKKKLSTIEALKGFIPKDLQKVIEERFVFSPDDIFKSVSILGAAFLIKSGIEWTEEIFSREVFKKLLLPPQFAIPITFFTGIFTPPTPLEPPLDVSDEPKREVVEWILSLTLGYLIVTNFGELVQAGASIINLAKGMITGIGLK